MFLSVLLDFFAAFFVGVIGEELRFRHFWRVHPPLTIDAITEPLPSITSVLSLQSKQTETCVSEPELSIAEQISQALASRALPCSKKGAKHFGLIAEEVDTLFAELMGSGQLGKKVNNHDHWIGTEV